MLPGLGDEVDDCGRVVRQVRAAKAASSIHLLANVALTWWCSGPAKGVVRPATRSPVVVGRRELRTPRRPRPRRRRRGGSCSSPIAQAARDALADAAEVDAAKVLHGLEELGLISRPLDGDD
jgi:hypothetical protein